MDMFITSTETVEEPVQVDSNTDYLNTEKTPVKHRETSHIDNAKYGIIRAKKESKNARVQLLVKPSVLAKLDEVIETMGVSRNELINYLIEDFLKTQKGE